jgi:hypothetical protein
METCDFILDSLTSEHPDDFKSSKRSKRNLCNVLNVRAAREAAVARLNMFCFEGNLKYKP